MRFDTWLFVMYKLTWEMYLALPDVYQTKLSDEYESSKQACN